MLTQTELDTHYVAMALPVEEQEIIDKISSLVLRGDVDFYQAKDCIECGDWTRARRLIREANNG